MGVSWDDIKEFEKKFEKKHRDALTIFTLRSIPIVPLVVVSTVSGVLRIKLRTFTVFTLAGSIVRCTILGFAGWMVGTTYASLAGGMDFLENLVTIILLALIVFVLVTAHRRRKRRISN